MWASISTPPWKNYRSIMLNNAIRIFSLACGVCLSAPFAHAAPLDSSVEIAIDGAAPAVFGSERIVQIASDPDTMTLTFRLDEKLAKWFENASGQNIGKTVSVAVCEHVFLRARIRAAIPGGVIRFSHLNKTQQDKLAKVLSGEQDCE